MHISIPKGRGSVSDRHQRAAIARSAIDPPEPTGVEAGWIVSRRESDAPVRISDASPTSKYLIKARHAAFDVEYGRAAWVERQLVIGSGPGEWTVIGPPGRPLDIELRDGATAVDITHGRTLIRLTGDLSPRVLEKVCSIDLADNMCPNLAAFRASVANVVTDAVRDDRETRSYLLSCERSSGQFLFDALLDAGAEFGMDIEGFQGWPPSGAAELPSQDV